MSNLISNAFQGSPSTSSNKTRSQEKTSISSDTNPCYHPDTQRKQGDFISSNEPSRRIMIAKCNHMSPHACDVSFQKDDRMEVLDDKGGDLLKVCHLTTKAVGYVLRSFVAEESKDQSKDWFMENVSLAEATKLLMNRDNPRGTFLVRPSEYNPGHYSLSVKDWDEEREYHLKHYIIERAADSGVFYIQHNQSYFSLDALIEAYSKNVFGLCHVLTNPCPKPQPQVCALTHLTSTYKDKWEIPRNEVVLRRVLGEGQFGTVYLGKWKDKKDVAVKTVKEGKMSTSAFLEEAAIMKKFRHNHLVAPYGVCSEDDPIYIVQEYMYNGSLLDVLRRDQGKTLLLNDLIYIAAQIASGMKYLESEQLIHLNLAARSVLIGENNNAKICSFRLARITNNGQYQSSSRTILAIKWTAPECFLKRIFSIKSNVWSYGILLMELFTYGKTPYEDMTAEEVRLRVQNGYRMPKPSMVMDAIYTQALECWNANPERRPTFENLTDYFVAFDVTTELHYNEADY